MSEDVPFEPREIQLRAFTWREGRKPRTGGGGSNHPSNRTLIFDTETTTDASQKLRFGVFELRDGDALVRQGVFHDPGTGGLVPSETETLIAQARELDLEVLTRAEFVEQILFEECQLMDGVVIGFNLPFDLSRLAIDHGTAKSFDLNVETGFQGDKRFQDGFSLKVSNNPERSRIAVKHLSSTMAFMGFKHPDEGEENYGTKQRSRVPGHFCDVRTLASALMGRAHSLESLSGPDGLDLTHPKTASDDHGKMLTPEYVRYAVHDVNVTWRCYAALRDRLASYDLDGVHPKDLFSDASLGKAYLRAMGIEPWLITQPDFDRPLLGQIMSTYFGGRSEVRIRRQITQTAYCDFASMYPTVNALMGLWDFLTAQGVEPFDATQDTRDILDTWTLADLRKPENWRHLTAIVQVQACDDVFPVRAVYWDGLPRYEANKIANIGVNRLTCEAPLWFTLADCLASKFLSGKSPEIVQAIGFKPKAKQTSLKPITVAGQNTYRVDPVTDDFFKSVIQMRRQVKKKQRELKDKTGSEYQRLDGEQHALKILANATSYGIFVETNVEKIPRSKSGERIMRWGHDGQPISVVSPVEEVTGAYFHPLLATLITGAARLMLTLAECKALEAGLDWVFCDTDGIAFAKPADMSRSDFIARVTELCGWFQALNPYEDDEPVLKAEDENFNDRKGDWTRALPLYCYAVSAKRYALFNLHNGQPVLRKASAHGLGHLHPPFHAPANSDWKPNGKAAYWHEELWRLILKAAMDGRDDDLHFMDEADFQRPAASRYSATSPNMVSNWFGGFNKGLAYCDQVTPFNFLFTFECRPLAMVAADDPDAAAWFDAHRTQEPKPAAPFDNDPTEAARHAFDRQTGKPVPTQWLKSYGQVLARYHLHTEAPFWGGTDTQKGVLPRRHVEAIAIRHIGKEAHNWEEAVYIGEAEEPATFGGGIVNIEATLERATAAYRTLGARGTKDATGFSDKTIKEALAGQDGGDASKELVCLVRAGEVKCLNSDD